MCKHGRVLALELLEPQKPHRGSMRFQTGIGTASEPHRTAVPLGIGTAGTAGIAKIAGIKTTGTAGIAGTEPQKLHGTTYKCDGIQN